ncbi:MAG: hypothetical protein RLZZ350_940 [Verrucomicrobiota bacterium]|jgi:membrane associated rhomboid family serine protease
MFFLIPIGVDYRANRYPVVTFSLIGLNVLLFFAGLFHAPFESAADADGFWYFRLGLVPATSPWFCWVTSLFVHGGWLHLIGNMIYLFLFGSPVEDMMGRWQYLLFYLLGGLAADFAYVAFAPAHFHSTIMLVGASGAISACMGAFALLMFRSKIEFKWFFFFFRLFNGEFFSPTWLVMSFWFLKDLASAFLTRNHHGGGTAFGAHVGGFVGGALMILLVKLLWSRGLMRRADTDDDEEIIVTETRPQPTPTRPAVSEAAEIYLAHNSQRSGPFTRTQVREFLAAGTVSEEAWYWCEGMAEWQGVWTLTQ